MPDELYDRRNGLITSGHVAAQILVGIYEWFAKRSTRAGITENDHLSTTASHNRTDWYSRGEPRFHIGLLFFSKKLELAIVLLDLPSEIFALGPKLTNSVSRGYQPVFRAHVLASFALSAA
jgi:hypothetical protein